MGTTKTRGVISPTESEVLLVRGLDGSPLRTNLGTGSKGHH